VELTEQEIEAIESILNDQEIENIDLRAIGSHSLVSCLDQCDCESAGVKFLVRLSVVPKFEEEELLFKMKDKVDKKEVTLRSLPAIELLIALPSSYPSSQKPLLLQMNKFYSDILRWEDFIYQKLDEKWSEDIPVLYEMVILL